MKKMTKVTPCLGKYALLTPGHKGNMIFWLLIFSKSCDYDPLFWDTWRLLGNFGTKGAKIV